MEKNKLQFEQHLVVSGAEKCENGFIGLQVRTSIEHITFCTVVDYCS